LDASHFFKAFFYHEAHEGLEGKTKTKDCSLVSFHFMFFMASMVSLSFFTMKHMKVLKVRTKGMPLSCAFPLHVLHGLHGESFFFTMKHMKVLKVKIKP